MTRKLVSIILSGLLLSLSNALVCGQSKIAKTSSKAAPRSSDARFLPLDDVRAGMKGVAPRARSSWAVTRRNLELKFWAYCRDFPARANRRLSEG